MIAMCNSRRLLLLAGMLAVGPAAAKPTPEPAQFPPLTWSIDDRVRDPIRVFTAPVDPDLVFVSSEQGLWRSQNGAGAWTLIPRTGTEVLGTIAHLEVCPAAPKVVVLASLEKGVFLSANGGVSWKPAGGVKDGLATPAVCFVTFGAEDRSWQTLLACHGHEHAGISKSIDGGRTWRLVAPRRHFRHLVSFGAMLSGVAATQDSPENWGLAFSQNYAENWRLVRNQVNGATGCPTTTFRADYPYGRQRGTRWQPDVLWGVSRGRPLLSQAMDIEFTEVGPADGGNWASVFTTPGPQPHQEWLWAYDPYRHGLVSAPTTKFDGPWLSNNRGLLVTRMIRRGANAAANAHGTKFYASVNHAIYIGTPVAATNAPTIVSAKITPPVFAFDRADDHRLGVIRAELKKAGDAADPLTLTRLKQEMAGLLARRTFHATVHVAHPDGPQGVASVQVMPARLSMPRATLYDDGKHGDGPANDGVWGGQIGPVGIASRPAGNLYKRYPGIVGMPIQVIDKTKRSASWTAVAALFHGPAPFMLWDGKNVWGRNIRPLNEGVVNAFCVPDPGGTEHVKISGLHGPWMVCWGRESDPVNATGLKHVVFEFRGWGGSGDVSFFLADLVLRSGRGSSGPIEPNYPSRFVPLIKDGYLPAMDGKYHVVRIPLMKLANGVRFMHAGIAGFGLRAEKSSVGGTYDFGQVWIEGDKPLKVPDLTVPRLAQTPEATVATIPDAPTVTAPHLTGPAPVIDGVLNDPAWNEAAVSDDFTEMRGGSKAAARARFRVAQDAANLYLAVECFDTPGGLTSLTANTMTHDGDVIWNDDEVEFFFDPTGTGKVYYQIIVNARGVTVDNHFLQPMVADKTWDPVYEAKTSVGTQSWIAEIAVPKAAFDRTPKTEATTTWLLNVTRNHPSTKQISCWSPMFCNSLHTPERFGRLVLEAPEPRP